MLCCFVQAVLQFPDPVSDLVEDHDQQLLYVACKSGVYCVSLQFLLSRYESAQKWSNFPPFNIVTFYFVPQCP